ncbi:MAG: TrmH family RNA methyltransferase [Steroidobacteraceae bacterium]
MTFEEIRQLKQRKHREAAGCYLVEGEHLILELEKAARTRPALRDATLYVSPSRADWRSPLKTQVISTSQMARLSDTREPQGLLAVVPMLPAAAPVAGERLVYLHEVQDPGNLGTLLRTLAWFGGFRCLLSPDSVDPYNPKAVRASMGAIFHLPVETGVALDAFAARCRRIGCLHLEGEPISSTAFAGCDGLLFGGEARGLPEAWTSLPHARAFNISGCGAIESLNLASAAAMCAWELNRSAKK